MVLICLREATERLNLTLLLLCLFVHFGNNGSDDDAKMDPPKLSTALVNFKLQKTITIN